MILQPSFPFAVLNVLIASLSFPTTALAGETHDTVLSERQTQEVTTADPSQDDNLWETLGFPTVDNTLSTGPNSKGLCRRWGHQSEIKDETLYLFGGNVLRQDGGNVTTQTNPDLLELNLSKSFSIAEGKIPWIRSSVSSTEKPPGVSGGGLYSGKNKSLYLYDGQMPPELQETPSSIWGYDVETKRWAQTSTWDHEDSFFPYRYSRGTYVTLPDEEVGYYIGGLRAYENSTFKGWYYGHDEQFVALNLTSGEVLKRSPLPLKQKRIGPRVVHLPVGPKGILVMIGGTEEHKVRLSAPKVNGEGIDPDDIRINPMSQMETIWIYDLDGQSWHFQSAIGNFVPWERKNFCMVAVSSQDLSTHHIYIYGGGTDSNVTMLGMNDIAYDDMYILNLPSFRYYQVPLGAVKPQVRQRMTCHVVNNKQMLVLGGHHLDSNGTLDSCSWDEVNLFDMTALRWLDEYSPQPDALFEVPEVAKEAAGTQPETGWDDPNLQKLFSGESADGCPTTAQLEQNLLITKQRSKIAIVASGVCGGLAFIFMCAMVFCARRRRRENENFKAELMQYQLYYQYQATGLFPFNRMSQSTGYQTFVTERSRPMTFWERMRFVLGLKFKGKEVPPADDAYSEKRPPRIPVENIP